MAHYNRSIAGGLLSGLGRGLQQRHLEAREDKENLRREKREDEVMLRENAIARAREIRQDLMRQSERGEDRADRIAESTADRVSREGEVGDVLIGDDRRARAITRRGDVKDLGFRAPPERTIGSGRDDSGMSPGQKRAFDAIVKRYTTNGLEGEATDWDRVVQAMRANPELAEFADDYDIGGEAPGPADENEAALDEHFRATDPVQEAAAETGDPYLKEFADIDQQARDESGRGYKSADDVKRAYRAGRLSKERATGILREQFGFD